MMKDVVKVLIIISKDNVVVFTKAVKLINDTTLENHKNFSHRINKHTLVSFICKKPQQHRKSNFFIEINSIRDDNMAVKDWFTIEVLSEEEERIDELKEDINSLEDDKKTVVYKNLVKVAKDHFDVFVLRASNPQLVQLSIYKLLVDV